MKSRKHIRSESKQQQPAHQLLCFYFNWFALVATASALFLRRIVASDSECIYLVPHSHHKPQESSVEKKPYFVKLSFIRTDSRQNNHSVHDSAYQRISHHDTTNPAIPPPDRSIAALYIGHCRDATVISALCKLRGNCTACTGSCAHSVATAITIHDDHVVDLIHRRWHC